MYLLADSAKTTTMSLEKFGCVKRFFAADCRRIAPEQTLAVAKTQLFFLGATNQQQHPKKKDASIVSGLRDGYG